MNTLAVRAKRSESSLSIRLQFLMFVVLPFLLAALVYLSFWQPISVDSMVVSGDKSHVAFLIRGVKSSEGYAAVYDQKFNQIGSISLGNDSKDHQLCLSNDGQLIAVKAYPRWSSPRLSVFGTEGAFCFEVRLPNDGGLLLPFRFDSDGNAEFVIGSDTLAIVQQQSQHTFCAIQTFENVQTTVLSPKGLSFATLRQEESETSVRAYATGELKKAEPLWVQSIVDDGKSPTQLIMSDNGIAFMAFHQDVDGFVVQVDASGTTKWPIAIGNALLALSPDQSKLVCMGNRSVSVFDIATRRKLLQRDTSGTYLLKRLLGEDQIVRAGPVSSDSLPLESSVDIQNLSSGLKTRLSFQRINRHWIGIVTVATLGCAIAWMIAWVSLGLTTGGQRRPWLDAFLFNGVFGGVCFLRLARFGSNTTTFENEMFHQWMVMFLGYCVLTVFIVARRPMRALTCVLLAGSIALLISNHFQLLTIQLQDVVALFAFGVSILLVFIVLRADGLQPVCDAKPLVSETKTPRLTISDLMLITAAIATAAISGKSLRLYFIGYDEIKAWAIYGVAIAPYFLACVWLAMGSGKLWLRLIVFVVSLLLLVAVKTHWELHSVRWAPTKVSELELASYWLVSAGVAVATLCIFRLHGYRLQQIALTQHHVPVK